MTFTDIPPDSSVFVESRVDLCHRFLDRLPITHRGGSIARTRPGYSHRFLDRLPITHRGASGTRLFGIRVVAAERASRAR